MFVFGVNILVSSECDFWKAKSFFLVEFAVKLLALCTCAYEFRVIFKNMVTNLCDGRGWGKLDAKVMNREIFSQLRPHQGAKTSAGLLDTRLGRLREFLGIEQFGICLEQFEPSGLTRFNTQSNTTAYALHQLAVFFTGSFFRKPSDKFEVPNSQFGHHVGFKCSFIGLRST